MSYWTEERISTLKTLWGEGHSAGVIAKRMDATRNSVIGKVHRLGLAKRQSTCRIIQLRPRRALPPLPKSPGNPKVLRPAPAAILALEPPPMASALRISLMDLTDNTCKCGLGDPKHPDFAFCGLPVKPGSRYCPGHHRRFYSEVRTKNANSKEGRRAAPLRTDMRFERWAA